MKRNKKFKKLGLFATLFGGVAMALSVAASVSTSAVESKATNTIGETKLTSVSNGDTVVLGTDDKAYFNGTFDGNWGKVTKEVANAFVLKIETVTGGFKLVDNSGTNGYVYCSAATKIAWSSDTGSVFTLSADGEIFGPNNDWLRHNTGASYGIRNYGTDKTTGTICHLYSFSSGGTATTTQYQIIFDANGGTGNQSAAKADENSTFTLPTKTDFTAPSGKKFDGWSASPNGDKILSIDVGTADVTVYARWIDAPTFAFSFDGSNVTDGSTFYLTNNLENFVKNDPNGTKGLYYGTTSDEPGKFSLETATGGYLIKDKDGKYLKNTSGTNIALDNQTNASIWEIGEKDGHYTLFNTGNLDSGKKRYLGLNSTTDMRAYSGNNSAVYIAIDDPGELSSIAVDATNVNTLDINTEFVKPVVTATFGAKSLVVTQCCEITGYDMSTAGSQTVNVSFTYKGVTKNATYTLTIASDPIVSAVIDGKVTGTISGGWNLDGIVLNYTTQKGNTGTATEGFTATTTTANPTEPGKYSVTVDISGYTVSVESKTFENVVVYRETSTKENPLTVEDAIGFLGYQSDDFKGISEVYVKGVVRSAFDDTTADSFSNGCTCINLAQEDNNDVYLRAFGFVDGEGNPIGKNTFLIGDTVIVKGILSNHVNKNSTYKCIESLNDQTPISYERFIISLESISIQSSLEMVESTDRDSSDYQLSVVFNPSNASDKEVTWESSDTEVATVSNGLVHAKKPGTTTITVTSHDGNKVATCNVVVTKYIAYNYAKVTSITEGNYIIRNNDFTMVASNSYSSSKLNAKANDDLVDGKLIDPTKDIVWKLIAADGGYIIQSLSNGKYLTGGTSTDLKMGESFSAAAIVSITENKKVAGTFDLKFGEGRYLGKNISSNNPIFGLYAINEDDGSYSYGSSFSLLKELEKASIRINANGGTGPEGELLMDLGDNFNLPSGDDYSKEGYDFGGWMCGGQTYSAREEITISASGEYAARWVPIEYTISYDGNGADNGTVPETVNLFYRNITNVASPSSLAKTGYTFVEWNTMADGSGTAYPVGAEIAPTPDNRDIVLFAQWTANDQTVTLTGDDHATIEGNTTVKYDASYEATIKLDKYYVVDTVTVTMGGTDITATALNGNEISIETVTGDIVVTVTSKIAEEFSASFTGTHVSSSNNATTLNIGAAYETTLTADTNFAIDEVVVKMGGEVVDGAFDAASGKVSIAEVTGDVSITATAKYLAGFSLSKSTINAYTGDAAAAIDITEEHNFDSATKVVTWTSNNEEVATVNNGLVTFVGAGEATITVTIKDSNNIEISKTVAVTVTESSSTLSVDKDIITLSGDSSAKITATVENVVGNQSNDVKVTYDETKITVLAAGNKVESGSTVESGTELEVVSANTTVNVAFADTITLSANGNTKTVAVSVDNRIEYTKVTSVDGLHAGDYVTLYCEAEGKIAGDIAGETKYLSSVADAKEGDKLLGTQGIIELQLIKVGDKWAFYLEGKGFLSCSTVKELKFSETLTDDCLFSITFDADGNVLISNDLGTFKYNSNNPRFTTYATGQLSIQLYVSETANKTVDSTGLSITGAPEDNKLAVGATVDLNATVTPIDATDQTVTWKSSNERIATVDENGKVTAIQNGTVTITATDAKGNKVTLSLTVYTPVIDVTSISVEQDSFELDIGGTAKIQCTVNPENASNKGITFSSSDSSIARVDAAGNIRALSEGTVTITITSVSDPTITATITVTVRPDTPVDPVDPVNPVDPTQPEEPVNPVKPGNDSKKGCFGSVVATSAMLTIVSLAGLGLAVSKKKED